jgi:uncharacterized membrane protein YbhN (UPF0104 family)
MARVRQILLPLVAVAVAVVLVLRSHSLLAPFGHLGRPDARWLAVAVAAQALSIGAYALGVRELLRIGGVAARVRSLVRATVGGIAMSASLPGGQAASAVYWYRQLRQEGGDSGSSAFAMVGAMVAGILSLGSLLVFGVIAAGDAGPLAAVRLPIVAAGAAVVCLLVVFRKRIAQLLRVPGRFRADRRGIVAVGVLAYANWLLDCAALCAALAAVHASVPLRSILLTYALAQLVASIPLLPGGGGTVEATLTLGFAAFGHTTGSVLAGVLLFRVVSCWGLVPIGWLAVALEGRRLRRPSGVLAAAAPA